MKAKIIVASTAVVLIAGFAWPGVVSVWDGSFGQAEYQLTFQDSDGNAVEGVELRVEDVHGNNYYHFPVTNYLPGSTPTSDSNGVLTFHHVNYFGVEFGGRCSRLLGFAPSGNCSSSRYICRFFHNGRQIFQCAFNHLNGYVAMSPDYAKRSWNWLATQPVSPPVDGDAEGWLKLQRQAFDRDHDGTLNIAEGAAYQAMISAIDKAIMINDHSKPESEELMFTVVKRTIRVK